MTWQEQLLLGINHIEKVDDRLATVIHGSARPTFEPHTDYYNELVSSIISQQLSVKAAATINKRFIDSFGHLPTPEEILAREEYELRAVGLSGQKTRYIKDLAHKIVSSDITFAHLDEMSNEAITSQLTLVKGVGEWTVHMFLIFCMGRLDVLPTGDLGIKSALKRLYQLDTLPTPDQINQIARDNKWHPYESVASWYLWKSLDTNDAIN